jgi:thiamine-phosphate pyrophosphorylase
MALRPAEIRSPARLYLIAALAEDTSRLARSLAAVCDVADVAALLLRLPDTDEDSLIKLIKSVGPTVQSKGVAVLLDGRPDLVAGSGADGAHLVGIDALTAVIAGLKPDRIAGAGGLKTRHDAMLAGEAGADYVMFGEPDPGGTRPSFEALVERTGWWAEVFEVPCVAFATAPHEAAALAAAGADFVAVSDLVFGSGDPATNAKLLGELLARNAVRNG